MLGGQQGVSILSLLRNVTLFSPCPRRALCHHALSQRVRTNALNHPIYALRRYSSVSSTKTQTNADAVKRRSKHKDVTPESPDAEVSPPPKAKKPRTRTTTSSGKARTPKAQPSVDHAEKPPRPRRSVAAKVSPKSEDSTKAKKPRTKTTTSSGKLRKPSENPEAQAEIAIPATKLAASSKTSEAQVQTTISSEQPQTESPFIIEEPRGLRAQAKVYETPVAKMAAGGEKTHVLNGEIAPQTKEEWMVQKAALDKKFGEEGWNPLKKLSPDALDGIRALHKQQPDIYSTAVLAQEFEVSPEAIRRILKSKWKATDEVAADRRRRWEKRGETIWATKAKEGVKPPKKWREALGIRLQPGDGTGRIRGGLGRNAVPGWASANDIPFPRSAAAGPQPANNFRIRRHNVAERVFADNIAIRRSDDS